MSLHGIAFAELVEYIESHRDSSECAPVFKMADLAKLYFSRLSELGITGQIHTTRLRQKVLAAVPDLRCQSQGRDVLLKFDHDIGNAIM